MWRQLIGSSNVYRVYKHESFKDYPAYEMVNCTKKEVFKAALDNLNEGNGEVIISVLENFLCDEVKGITDPGEMNDALEKTIKEYLALIKDVACKRPDVKFALTQITLRPLHQWYTDCHDTLCKELGTGIRMMDKLNVGKIDGPIKMSQVFEKDGVHLTPSSGKVFVNTILYNAGAFLNTEVVELNEDMEVEEEGEDPNLKVKIGRRITLVE